MVISQINEASITGESMLVTKIKDQHVFAGTVNYEGILHIKVTNRSEDFIISQIVKIVQEAKEKKARTQHFTDNVIGQYYAMSVIIITFLYAMLNILLLDLSLKTIFYKSMTLMVAASPCALVLSIPTAILSALANATSKGILFKGGRLIEKAAKTTIVALDKTGTLTLGKFAVEEIKVIDKKKIQAIANELTSEYNHLPLEEILLLIFASLEKSANHPISDAIIEKATKHNLKLLPTQHFKNIPGQGIVARIKNIEYQISNPLTASKTNKIGQVEIKKLQSKNQSVIVLSVEQKPIGIIGLKDQLRQEASQLVSELKKIGIKKIILLTGDNENTAKVISSQLQLTSYHANLLPQDKLKLIKKLQQDGTVAMVGDGINDAPALASADLGIAMGAAGSDIAIESADVLLMNDNLKNIPWLLTLSKRSANIIKQNIIFSSIMILLLITLTILDYISLPLRRAGTRRQYRDRGIKWIETTT